MIMKRVLGHLAGGALFIVVVAGMVALLLWAAGPMRS